MRQRGKKTAAGWNFGGGGCRALGRAASEHHDADFGDDGSHVRILGRRSDDFNRSSGRLAGWGSGIWISLLLALPAGAAAKTWDRGGGNNNWGAAANWKPDGVPAAGDTVTLDHSNLGGAYTVVVDVNTNALAGLTLDPAGGGKAPGDITLDLSNNTLNVNSGTASVLAQNGASGNVNITASANYTANISGGWTNNGNALNATNGTFNFTGSGTIGGTAADVFRNLNVSAVGRTTTLAKNLAVANVLQIQGGVLNSSAAGFIRSITLTRNGDPLNTTAGLVVTDVRLVLDPGAGNYNLNGINGPLFDLEVNDQAGNGSGGAPKFGSNTTLRHDLRMMAGALDSKNITLTIENDFFHDGGTADFAAGTVVLNGAYDGTGEIGGAAATLFDSLTLGQAGQTRALRLAKDITVGKLLNVTGGTTSVVSTVPGTPRAVTLTDNVDPLDVAAATTITDVKMRLDPSGNYTLGGVNAPLFSLELNDTGAVNTVTAGQALTMTADFVLTAGIWMATTNNNPTPLTHAVGRDLVFTGGTFNATNGSGVTTFNLNGTGQLRGASMGTLTFYNLTVAAAGKTTTFARNATVTNDLTFGTGTANSDVAGATRTVTLTKNTNPVAFGASSPTITGDVRLNLQPSASYALSWGISPTLGSVQVTAGAGTITLGQALTLNGDLVVTSGTLATGAFTHALKRGFLWDGGTLTTTGTSFTFAGTGTIGGAAAGALSAVNVTINGAAADTVTLVRGLTAAGAFSIAQGKLTTSGLTGAITVNAQSGLSVGDGSGGTDTATLELIGAVTLAVQSGQALTVSSVDGRFNANSNADGAPAVTRIGAGTYAFTLNGTLDVNALSVDWTDGNGMNITIPNGSSPNVVNLNNVAFSNSATVSLKITLNAGVYGCAVAPVDFVGHVYNGSGVTNIRFLPAGGCGAGGSNACPGTAVSGYVRMVGFGGANGGDASDADCANPADEGSTGTVVKWAPPKKWVSSAGGSTDWFTASNWNPSGVPASSDTVVIPMTTDPDRLSAAMPSVGGAAANAGSIVMQSGTTLTLAASQTLNVAGSWSLQGGALGQADFLPGAGSTVHFNGGAAQVAPNETYENVTVSNAAGVTFGNGSGTVTVNGKLTVTGSLNWGNGTVVLAKDAAFNGASSSSAAGSGTARLDGGASPAITTDQASKTVTFGGLTVNGTIAAGSAAKPVDVVVRRTLTIGSGSSLSLAGAARTLTLGGTAGVTGVWNDLNAGGGGFVTGDDAVVFEAPVDGPSRNQTFAYLTVNGSGASLARIQGGTTTVSSRLTVNGGQFTINPGATVALSSAVDASHTVGSGGTLRLESNPSSSARLEIAGNDLHTFSVVGKLKTVWDETLSPLPPRPTITRRAGDPGRFAFAVSGTLSVEGLAFSFGDVDGLLFTGTGAAHMLRNVDFTDARASAADIPTPTERAGAHVTLRTTGASVSAGGCAFELIALENGTTLSTAAGSRVVSASGNRVSNGCRKGHILQIQSGGDAGGYVITDTNATDGSLTPSELRLDSSMTAAASGLTFRVVSPNIRAEDTNGGDDLRVMADAADTTLEEDRDIDDFNNSATGGAETKSWTAADNVANTSRVDWVTRATNLIAVEEAGSESAGTDAELAADRQGTQRSFTLTFNSAAGAGPPPTVTDMWPMGPRGYYLLGRNGEDELVCVELASATTVGKLLARYRLSAADTDGVSLPGEAIGPPMAVILAPTATTPNTIGTKDGDTTDTLTAGVNQVEDIFFGTSNGWLYRLRYDPAAKKLRLCDAARGGARDFPGKVVLDAAVSAHTFEEFTSPLQFDIFNPARIYCGARTLDAGTSRYYVMGVGIDTREVIVGGSPLGVFRSGDLTKAVRPPFAVLASGSDTIVFAGTDGNASPSGGSLYRTSTATGFNVTVSCTPTAASVDHFRTPVTLGIDGDRVYAGNMNGRVYGRSSAAGLAAISGYPDAGYPAGAAVAGGVALGWDPTAGGLGYAAADNIFFGDDAGNFHGVNGLTGAKLDLSFPVPLDPPGAGRTPKPIRSYPLEGPFAGQAAGQGNYFYVGNNDGALFWIDKFNLLNNGVYRDLGPGRRLRDIAAVFGRMYVPTDKGEVFVLPLRP